VHEIDSAFGLQLKQRSVRLNFSICEAFKPANEGKESGCSFRKKREVWEEELKKNEGAQGRP